MFTRIRDFSLKDITPIDNIFKKQPEVGVPGFKHLVSNATITNNDGEVIGYGAIKHFAEGILVLDKSKRKRERAEAVKLVVEKAINDAKDHDIEQLYFLTSNPSFADVLRKHWGFKNVKEEVLRLQLDED